MTTFVIKLFSSLWSFWIRTLCGGLTIVFISVVSCSESNSPTEPDPSPGSTVTSFEVSFGGSSIDAAEAAVLTRDGSYIVVGRTKSFNAVGYDLYMVKLNSSGTKVWEKVYGATYDDIGYDIIAAPGGGYVVTGKRGSALYLCKIDEAGTLIWQKSMGDSLHQEGRAIIPTSDGGFAIAGWTDSYGAGGQDVFLVKVDSVGEMQWQKTYGGSGSEQGRAIVQTEDGGFAVAGWTNSIGAGEQDVYLVRTDSSGNLIWQQSYGGSLADEARDLMLNNDGTFLIAGWTESVTNGGVDVLLVRADAQGNGIHQKIFGGQFDDYAWSIAPAADGAIVVGWTQSYGNGNNDVYAIKTDGTDQYVSQETFGGTGSDQGFAVLATSDGGYLIAGGTTPAGSENTDLYVIKTIPQ